MSSNSIKERRLHRRSKGSKGEQHHEYPLHFLYRRLSAQFGFGSSYRKQRLRADSHSDSDLRNFFGFRCHQYCRRRNLYPRHIHLHRRRHCCMQLGSMADYPLRGEHALPSVRLRVRSHRSMGLVVFDRFERPTNSICLNNVGNVEI